ncbi:hypothetical protein [Parasphingopyxis sp.]|uniref:hypothetical protein n=1 Tax=Parasphingopyxis sp. TaxID=1920299 RepID=UPI00345AD908
MLAAGRSERFGAENKLTAKLSGKMIGAIVVEKLAQLNWKTSSVNDTLASTTGDSKIDETVMAVKSRCVRQLLPATRLTLENGAG